MELKQMINKNLLRWNEITAIHEKSDFYDVDGFLAGNCTLKSIELEELGDVRGKSLLHLQCHFGLDSLSWARLGAQVTGVDISNEAIELAKSLSEKSGVNARFVCSDLYSSPEVLPNEKFDIVFTSYGVLCWLADISKWAQIVSGFLKPGGIFLIVEGHPMDGILNWEDSKLKISYPYFDKEAIECFSETSYADRITKTENTVTYQWQHTLGDIITSLIDAGLTLNSMKEYPFSAYEKFPGYMQLGDDGWWRFITNDFNVPLLFSIKATKK